MFFYQNPWFFWHQILTDAPCFMTEDSRGHKSLTDVFFVLNRMVQSICATDGRNMDFTSVKMGGTLGPYMDPIFRTIRRYHTHWWFPKLWVYKPFNRFDDTHIKGALWATNIPETKGSAENTTKTTNQDLRFGYSVRISFYRVLLYMKWSVTGCGGSDKSCVPCIFLYRVVLAYGVAML